MFDTSFVNDLQQAVFQFQKLVISLPMLVIMASLARLLLWALLTPVAGRAFGGLLANIVFAACAVVLLTHPPLAWAAINWSYGLTSKFITGADANGLPGFGTFDYVMRQFDDAFNQVTNPFG